MNVEIRQETATDFSEVYELNKIAFTQDNEARLVDQLRLSDAFIPELSLVAVLDGRIVGHILFTKIKILTSAGKEFNSLALAPMAVAPDLQKQGIGGQLIRFGLNKARELGHQSVIVLGHEHYYPKFGFEPAEKWKIKAPWDVPSTAFMGIELVKDGLLTGPAIVQYPKEFDMV